MLESVTLAGLHPFSVHSVLLRPLMMIAIPGMSIDLTLLDTAIIIWMMCFLWIPMQCCSGFSDLVQGSGA